MHTIKKVNYSFGYFPPDGRRFLAALLIVLLSIMALTTSCSKQENPDGSPELLAALTFSASNIMIDNGNDFIWKDVSIQINEAYTYKSDMMPRGLTSIPLSEFHTAQGLIFDTSSMTAHQLTIEVKSGFEGKSGRFKW